MTVVPGPRKADEPADSLFETVERLIPRERRFDDPLSTLAFGTDASFYRLIPKLVLRVESEDEVAAILSAAYREQVPVTFRAAGTSLSGQAISDSVLLVLGDNWNGREIRADGAQIRLQPGVIGAQANAWLAPFGRKIGPDPASINACKIGGIVANNASGMCCGTAQNSYHTLAGLRLLLADGTRLDSEDPASVAAFRASHGELLERLAELGRETRANAELAAKIRHKYRLKNTTGLSLNALVDYDEPLDILTHLMVGSEGTLGFISAVTYDTVPEHPHKASALLVFPTVETCCTAVAVLKRQPVSAVELLDRRSLRSVENMQGMPEWVKSLSAGACALLIESRAASRTLLHEQLGRIMASIAEYPLEKQVDFSEDPAVYNQLWRIRKDTFPAVGAVRETGTTVIIEDVTFPVERLAEGVNRLIELFDKHRYDEAILFGHALEGNLHFVFTQGFDSPEQIARYSAFMDDVAHLVAVEYGGSLKAEHGTGRNMAPFVELEWGEDAYRLMWQLKRLLDPRGILNPGVVLSDDPQSHLKNLKPLPAADEIVDKCIECGFCEPVCPSRGLTLTPRQRIVLWRDIQAKKRAGVDTTALERDYRYQGIDTCAATGLCAQRCPVNINTGELIRKLRGADARHAGGATWLARNFAGAMRAARFALLAADGARRLLARPCWPGPAAASARPAAAACRNGRRRCRSRYAWHRRPPRSTTSGRGWSISPPASRVPWARPSATKSASRCWTRPAVYWKKPATRWCSRITWTTSAAASRSRPRGMRSRPTTSATSCSPPCSRPAAAASTRSTATPVPAPCAWSRVWTIRGCRSTTR